MMVEFLRVIKVGILMYNFNGFSFFEFLLNKEICDI